MEFEKKFDVLLDAETMTPTSLEEAINEAGRAVQDRLRADPEWNTPRWTSPNGIVAAFAAAIFESHMWHDDYVIPPHLPEVLARLAQEVATVLAKSELDQLVKVSLLDLEAIYWRVCEMPEVIAWNEMMKPFIDLHALVRNAAIQIRTERRDFDQFNAEFDRQHSQIKEQ